jgi:hypothetical protein
MNKKTVAINGLLTGIYTVYMVIAHPNTDDAMTRPTKITRLLAVDDNSEVSSWIGDPEHLIFNDALVRDRGLVPASMPTQSSICGDYFFADGSPVAYFAPPMFRRAA